MFGIGFYICCGDSFGEICHREKHGGLIRGDDPQLKIIWSIITWVALISSDQPQSFIFVGTRIQQQLGVKMMMITIFIICLMLSVSCDKSRIMIGANALENTFDFLK